MSAPDIAAHNALVMRLGNALEGVEADRATAAMLEVIAINIIESAAGDDDQVSQLMQLADRTLDNFVGLHLATFAALKSRGLR